MTSTVSNMSGAELSPKIVDDLLKAVSDLEEQVNLLHEKTAKSSNRPDLYTYLRWAGAAIAGVFLAGVSFSTIKDDIITKSQFDPVALRVTTLENRSNGSKAKLATLETRLESVDVNLTVLKTSISKISSTLDKVAERQGTSSELYKRDRYCIRLITEYTQQLQEYTTKIRRTRPDYPEDLRNCRVGELR